MTAQDERMGGRRIQKSKTMQRHIAHAVPILKVTLNHLIINERANVDSFYAGLDHWMIILKELAGR